MKNRPVDYLYFHVPFCLRKCGYCSFYSEVFDEKSKAEYLSALQNEIELFQKELSLKPMSLYFGGGTPSLLSGKELNSIIHQFDLSQIEEITLEANPVNITEKYVDEISNTEINRISLGVQSFKDDELKLLGRLHNSQQVEKAFRILRKQEFRNISIDLIYGLPDQTESDLLYSLEKFTGFKPEHISTYCLSLEEEVPLYPLKNKIPEDETISDFYFLIRDKLLDEGYEQYEISNFSKPGFESKHNLCYWKDKSFLGFGPSAAGYLNNGRYSNPANLEEYCQQIKSNQIMQNFFVITAEDHEKEFIFLTLRKSTGMNLKEFSEIFGIDFLKKYEKIVEKFSKDEFLEIEGENIRLTPQAYFISNEIFAEFM